MTVFLVNHSCQNPTESSAHNASVPDELWAQRDQPALEDIKWDGLRHRGGETVPDWNSPMNHRILEEEEEEKFINHNNAIYTS